jgi:predicted RNA-binding protein
VVEETVIVTEMGENGDIITIKIDLTGEITVETQIEEIPIEAGQEGVISIDVILTEVAQEGVISTDVILIEVAQEGVISTDVILIEAGQEGVISTDVIQEIIDLITVRKRFTPIMIGHVKSAIMSTFHLEKNVTDVGNQKMDSLEAGGITTVAISKETIDKGKVMTHLENSVKQEENLQIMPTIEVLSH